MFYSLMIGGLVGCAFFVVLIHTTWCPLLGSVLYLIYEVIYHYPTFYSLFNALFVFLFLFISSRLLYHPYGKPVTIWSSMFMRDDQWIKVLNYTMLTTIMESLQLIFTLDSNSKKTVHNNTGYLSVSQHINCIMCYVAHLPTKEQLTGVISNIISNYPQLTNIPIVGDDMTQSSFQTDYSIYNDVDSHIFEYRLNKKQIEDLDEIMSNKIAMNLNKPWWDIFLVTPDVENDIRALDPQHAMLCVVVFRFHQSIIDLPTIKQFLYNMSTEFEKLNGFDDDIDFDDEKATNSSRQLFGSPMDSNRSQFGLRAPSADITDNNDCIINEINQNESGSTTIQDKINYFKTEFDSLSDILSLGLTVINMFYVNGNCFEVNNGYSCMQIITERFEDTALTKIEREAKANLKHISRACIAGALLRYFSDSTDENEDEFNIAGLSKARILESYDLSKNLTAIDEVAGAGEETDIPLLFKETYGLTSIELCIDDGGQEQTPRSRLMSIAHDANSHCVYYRVAFWINKYFKFLCIFLPDLVSKKLISVFVQNHTMELCYFEFKNNFFLGNEPVEDLRVFKTNLCVPCLCVSSYNEHISLDLAFTSVAVKNPPRLIQGFLAELEQLQAMFR